MSFAKLKKNRKSAFEKLSTELEKSQSGNNYGNDLPLWTPTVDKVGNGHAIIRFIPTKDEELPWVRMFSHAFQDKGGWYIENSLTTMGSKDPLSEYNSYLWNSGIESNKEVARKQKRRLHYYSNIYVVSDPANPSNEGKVFLYKYGKKIFDMLNDVMHPEFDDEVPINPFDLWEGANFKLKIRQVEGYRNYDKSTFDSTSVLSKPDGVEMTDEELEQIYNSTHSLEEIIAPKNFKTYEELLARLNKVVGFDTQLKVKGVSSDELAEEQTPAPTFQESAPTEPKASASDNLLEEDEDDAMAFFDELAED